MKRITTAVATALLVLGAAGSAHAAPDPSLAKQLRSDLRAGALGADVTLSVVEAATGEVLFDHDAAEPQLPASTMKVITATTSLASLGARHRFETSVVLGPSPKQIVLVGGGDPMLTSSDLRQLAQRTAKRLPTMGVDGTVEVGFDDYLFPRPTNAKGWAPGDMPAYAAAVRPLAMLGDYSTSPSDNAASVFLQALAAQGVSVRDVGRTSAAFDAPVVARTGNTLARAIRLMFSVSENNIAEVLFRQVALANGFQASWIGSGQAAVKVLTSLGVTTTGLRLQDGSGLSAKDRVPATVLTKVLSLSVNGDDTRIAPLVNWLPVAGESGTLTYRFAAPPASCARGEVSAKTGSITGVNTLAGVTRGPAGEWRAFAVMVNHRPEAYPNFSTSFAVDTVAATVHGCT